MRDLASRFDNRLFLSATPHNGHSNSFSALLELLDPQRFTRGVRPSRNALDTVMVRRLKPDLRRLGVERFPTRKVVQLDVGTPNAPEVRLSDLLAEYTRLMRPARGRGKLVFVNLQKRLLSSVEAFRRTLDVHARSVEEGRAKAALQLDLSEVAASADAPNPDDDDEYGPDDDALEAVDLSRAASSSRLLQTPEGRARQVLSELQTLAAQHATAPDAKVDALVRWIQTHQCRGVRIGGTTARGADLDWSDRRVIVFTEYGDTKRYLAQVLA
ncbi:MAG: hypothetical protein HYZ27_01965, partial [Deltaproteobacteria bacterium]|nr:hypothetical protein [Deltaproteobacteria bacterium]